MSNEGVNFPVKYSSLVLFLMVWFCLFPTILKFGYIPYREETEGKLEGILLRKIRMLQCTIKVFN